MKRLPGYLKVIFVCLLASSFLACESPESKDANKTPQKPPVVTATPLASITPEPTPTPRPAATPIKIPDGKQKVILTAKPRMTSSKVLDFQFTFSNKTSLDYLVPGGSALREDFCHVSVDGTWYNPGSPKIKRTSPGKETEKLAAGAEAFESSLSIRPWSIWVDPDGYLLYPLSAGRHQVRVAVALQPADGQPGGEIIVASEPVEIDIRDFSQFRAPRPEAPPDPEGWDKAMRGIQARMVPGGVTFGEDKTAFVNVVLRNTDSETRSLFVLMHGTSIVLEDEEGTRCYQMKGAEHIPQIWADNVAFSKKELTLAAGQETEPLPIKLDFNLAWGQLVLPFGTPNPGPWEPGGGSVYREESTGRLRMDPEHPDAQRRIYVDNPTMSWTAGKKWMAIYLSARIILTKPEGAFSTLLLPTQAIEVMMPALEWDALQMEVNDDLGLPF